MLYEKDNFCNIKSCFLSCTETCERRVTINTKWVERKRIKQWKIQNNLKAHQEKCGLQEGENI